MQSIEIEAKTVADAIAEACRQLDTASDALTIEILAEPRGKLLGLFAGKKARIRATRKTAGTGTNAITELARILETIVDKVQPGATVEVVTEGEEPVLNISGDGSGIFIGKRGQTLEAFQYLINKIRLSKFRDAPHITVDSEGYRTRHVESLLSLANRLSEKAKKRQGPVTTNLLNPGDRRVIHMALKKDPELTTWSKGDGTMKKVIIAPKQSPQN